METLDIKTKQTIFMDDIENLDFSMLKRKLQDKDEGQGWTAELCDDAEYQYKRFLALKRLFPNKDIVPNGAIDKFWHQHILDTAQYAVDCEIVFGYFLHHFPYFGMNGDSDAQNLTDAFEETKDLYFEHFGEEYVGMAKRCTAPKCRTQCKPMKCK